jgi:hypothetical protein
MSDDDNPLQKYADAWDDPDKFIQPRISPELAQYILKALDCLEISSKEDPSRVERKFHDHAEALLIDIISDAPEDDSVEIDFEEDEVLPTFSVPIGGWTWFCEYHDIYGLADDKDEALFMAGAHLHYYQVDEDNCNLHFKQHGIESE